MALVLAGTMLAIVNAAGAAGRIFWGWLADRLASGSAALILNGAIGIAGALATAALAPHWPLALTAAAGALFGFCVLGWNGVVMAVIVRRSPANAVAYATGGTLSITWSVAVLSCWRIMLTMFSGLSTYPAASAFARSKPRIDLARWACQRRAARVQRDRCRADRW